MANDGMKGFEMPAEMKAFAEKGMAQARTAFETFLTATQHAVNTATTQASTAQGGVRQVGELAVKFAQTNVASSFDFAQRLVGCKDPQEVASLYTDYVKTQVATLTEQAKEMQQAATAAAKPSA